MVALGFSSFKFVPGTQDHDIVALKTMELDGVIQTFVTVFDLAGKVLLDISLIGTRPLHFEVSSLQY